MSEEILYKVEKHGYFSIEYPFEGAYGGLIEDTILDSRIWITSDRIGITDKDGNYPMEILFKDINKYTEFFHPPGQKKYKIIKINYSNIDRIYLLFLSSFGWKEEIHNEFFKVLQENIEKFRLNYFKINFPAYIAPYDEVTFESISEYFKLDKDYIKNEINKMVQNGKLKGQLRPDKIIFREPLKEEFKANFFDYVAPYDEVTFDSLSEHFKLDKDYIINEIKKMLEKGKIEGRLCSDRIILREPTPKLAAMKCPNCNAPLDSIPPCKCDHCGVMVDLIK